MRWERLFQDLEGQLEYETDAELEDLARDEERLRVARLTLADRVRNLSADKDVTVTVRLGVGRHTLECVIVRVGRDWALVRILSPLALRGEALVPLGAISRFEFESTQNAQRSLAPRASRALGLANDIGLPFVLRDLCRRRRHVTLVTHSEDVSGTIERVGRDHVDVAVHLPHHSRATNRDGAVTTVPFDHLLRVSLSS